jgi:hypothetical protein
MPSDTSLLGDLMEQVADGAVGRFFVEEIGQDAIA